MGKSVLHSLIASRKSSGLLLLGRSSERKRLLKMCVRKLQSIDDPETFLCRSVLINNTLKTLQTVQREARAKKDAREQLLLLNTKQDHTDDSQVEFSEDTEVMVSSDNNSDLTAEEASTHSSSTAHTEKAAAATAARCADDSCYDLDGYNAEDILSDIVMPPPPLSPQLEDMTHMVVPASSSPSISEGAAAAGGLSPLLSGHSPLSSGWADSETLDWADHANPNHWPSSDVEAAVETTSDLRNEANASSTSPSSSSSSSSISWGEDSIFWERALPSEDLTATLDLTLIRGGPTSGREREAVVPTKEEDSGSDSGCDSASVEDQSSSEGELYDIEVSCTHSYIANIQPVAISSLIATMES